MNELPVMLIDDVSTWLRRELDSSEPAPLTIALASWLGIPAFPLNSSIQILTDATATSGASRRHQDVAIVGYHLAEHSSDKIAVQSFLEGLEWLTGRADFIAEGVPTGLLLDWPSLLGIHCGITAVGTATTAASCQWFKGICSTAAEIRGSDEFLRAILSYLKASLDVTRWSCPAAAADFHAALYRKGIVPADEADWQAVWRLVTEVESCRGDPNRHLVRLAATQTIRTIVGASNLSAASRAQLLALARGVQHSFLRWPWELKARTRRDTAVAQRWDLQNEYHFQSLLWAVIKPVFGDLEEETYMPRTGQLQPRADLCIPSIKTVIEVKFWYTGARVTKLIEEIAADHSLYLRSGSPYDSLLVLVWDEQRRSEEHGELVRGLEGLRGILGVVVIPRPARMEIILEP